MIESFDDVCLVEATEADIDHFMMEGPITFRAFQSYRDDLAGYRDEIAKFTPLEDGFTFYHLTGKQMNDHFGFAGERRFDESAPLIVLKLDSVRYPSRLNSQLMFWGANYFPDLVYEHYSSDLEEGRKIYMGRTIERVRSEPLNIGMREDIVDSEIKFITAYMRRHNEWPYIEDDEGEHEEHDRYHPEFYRNRLKAVRCGCEYTDIADVYEKRIRITGLRHEGQDTRVEFMFVDDQDQILREFTAHSECMGRIRAAMVGMFMKNTGGFEGILHREREDGEWFEPL